MNRKFALTAIVFMCLGFVLGEMKTKESVAQEITGLKNQQQIISKKMAEAVKTTYQFGCIYPINRTTNRNSPISITQSEIMIRECLGRSELLEKDILNNIGAILGPNTLYIMDSILVNTPPVYPLILNEEDRPKSFGDLAGLTGPII